MSDTRGFGRRIAFASGLVLTASLVGCGQDEVLREGPSGAPSASTDGSAATPRPGSTGMGPLGFGRPASPEEVALWNIDVRPDGEGLPPGNGTVGEGAAVYRANCAACHGEEGLGGPNDALVGTEPRGEFPFGTTRGLTSAIGSYWPYATTVFDYVRRAMPFDRPGSLTDDEVYSITAWLLWRNGLIAEDAVMDATSLPQVVMPAKPFFVPSDEVQLTTLP